MPPNLAREGAIRTRRSVLVEPGRTCSEDRIRAYHVKDKVELYFSLYDKWIAGRMVCYT